MAAVKRVSKELQHLNKEPVTGIAAGPVSESNICNWSATLDGPPDSPYEQGRFRLNIVFPADYPFKPPKVTFHTKMWHPNVGCQGSAGHICLDILGNAWSPALSIQKVLISIVSLLTDPNPASPMNGDAASQYKNNRKKYNDTVREWVRMYAEKLPEKAKEEEPAVKKHRSEKK